MTIENALLCPAYYSEAKGFNPIHQPQQPVIRELVARVVALAAPIFYLYQVVLHGFISMGDIALGLVGFSPGILFQSFVPSVYYSARNFASALCEIPQKLVYGPHCQANYFGDSGRYKRINYLSTIGTSLM